MSHTLIEKLLKSFDELDQCITVTKDVLCEKQGVPGDVISRVEGYAQAVEKQRELTAGLRVYIEKQEWDEVSRHVKLINGLSAMIRDDAQAILSGSYHGDISAVNQESLI